MYSFEELFSGYLSEEVMSVFAGTAVADCTLDAEQRVLHTVLRASGYIKREDQLRCAEEIKTALQLQFCDLSVLSPADALNADACAELTAGCFHAAAIISALTAAKATTRTHFIFKPKNSLSNTFIPHFVHRFR